MDFPWRATQRVLLSSFSHHQHISLTKNQLVFVVTLCLLHFLRTHASSVAPFYKSGPQTQITSDNVSCVTFKFKEFTKIVSFFIWKMQYQNNMFSLGLYRRVTWQAVCRYLSSFGLFSEVYAYSLHNGKLCVACTQRQQSAPWYISTQFQTP